MDEENKEVKKQDIEPEDAKTNEGVENKKEEAPKEENKEVNKEEQQKEPKKEEQPKEVKKEETSKETKKEVKKEEPKKTTQKTTNKTFEKSKAENKKTNNGIIIAIVAVVAIVIIAIFACMNMVDSPKKVVENVFQELKSGNTSQSVLASAFEQENFDEETKKLLFDKLEWKILEVKEDGDTATVKVEVTNKDFKTAINNYMQKAIKAAFSGGLSNEEDATNYLMEELNSSELQTVTSEQTITLKKQDGKWEVSEDNDFVNILLPGFGEALSSFN